jgi:hypothetical protein
VAALRAQRIKLIVALNDAVTEKFAEAPDGKDDVALADVMASP